LKPIESIETDSWQKINAWKEIRVYNANSCNLWTWPAEDQSPISLRKLSRSNTLKEHLPKRGTQKIYHLFSRSLYEALGKENSRNRKPGRYGMLDKASVRLLGLDFVLANLDSQYLEEEADKVN
jgi:hypothetical protein